jgi:hypothetical protein
MMFCAEKGRLMVILGISQLLLHDFPTLDVAGALREAHMITACAFLVITLDASTLLPVAVTAIQTESFILDGSYETLFAQRVGKLHFGDPVYAGNVRPEVG